MFGDMPTPVEPTRSRDPDPLDRPPGPGAAVPLPEAPAALWAQGEFWLRVRDRPTGQNRVVRIARPFALVWRIAGADVPIDDRAVSARHLYLHLDPRGLTSSSRPVHHGEDLAGPP